MGCHYAGCIRAWLYIASHDMNPNSILVQVEQSVAGCARFTFDELCNRTLGAADYIAVAQTFHTVFLTDIPTMSLKVQQPLSACPMSCHMLLTACVCSHSGYSLSVLTTHRSVDKLTCHQRVTSTHSCRFCLRWKCTQQQNASWQCSFAAL